VLDCCRRCYYCVGLIMPLIHDDKPHKYRLPRIDAFGADRRDLIIEGVASVAEQHQPISPNRWITTEIFEREKLTIAPCAMFKADGDFFYPKNAVAESLCDLVYHDYLAKDQIEIVIHLGFNVEVKQ
jgi:hypothetical protein